MSKKEKAIGLRILSWTITSVCLIVFLGDIYSYGFSWQSFNHVIALIMVLMLLVSSIYIYVYEALIRVESKV